MKKKKLFVVIMILLLLSVPVSCNKNTPPDDGTPEPKPHTGTFISDYGTMTFNGDGESVIFDFAPDLQEATGLPDGEQKGTYVFLFQHGQWRYDKAERFRITASDTSYDFINKFTATDENTIALQSPINGKETILFKKGGNEQ